MAQMLGTFVIHVTFWKLVALVVLSMKTLISVHLSCSRSQRIKIPVAPLRKLRVIYLSFLKEKWQITAKRYCSAYFILLGAKLV